LNSLKGGKPLVNITPNLRELRAIKTNFEINQIEKAAKLVDQSFEYCIAVASPDMTEIELCTELDSWLLKNGHSGIVTIRGYNNTLSNYTNVVTSNSATLNTFFTHQ